MKTLVIPINWVCKSKCSFCQYKRFDGTNLVTLKDLGSYKDEYIRGRYGRVILTDWEPLEHPEIIDIIIFVQWFTDTCILESNSERFADNDFMKSFSEAIDTMRIYIKIPIYSAQAAIHDQITSGSLSVLHKSIQNLEKYNFHNLSFHCLVLQQNYKYLIELKDFVSSRWYNIKFIYTIPDWYISEEKILVRFKDIFKENWNGIVIENMPLCIWNGSFFNEWEKGTILDGKQVNFENDFLSGRLDKVYIDACNGCSQKGICKWIYKKYLQIFDASEFIAIK